MQRNERVLSVVYRILGKYILSIQYSDNGSGINVPTGYTKHDIQGTTDNDELQKRRNLDDLKLTNQFERVDANHPSDYVYDPIAMIATLTPPIMAVFQGDKVATKLDVKEITKKRIADLYGDRYEELKIMRHSVNGTAAQKTAARDKHVQVATFTQEAKQFITDQGW